MADVILELSASASPGGTARAIVLRILLEVLLHQRQSLHLEILEGKDCHKWCSEHFKNLINVVHMLADDTVRGAEGSHAHLLSDGLPVV